MKACPGALLLTGVFLVSSQALAQRGTPEEKPKKDASVYAEIAKAPEKARAKRNPMEKDPDAVPAGGILFEQHCAECHGKTAQGGPKGPNLRAPEIQNAEPGAIFWILTNGVIRKGMPVWSKLPEPQRWQLVSYLKSLGVATPKEESLAPDKAAPAKSTDSSLPRR